MNALKVEFDDGRIRYFYDVVNIDFYDDCIHVKDTDNIVTCMKISNKKNITIIKGDKYE